MILGILIGVVVLFIILGWPVKPRAIYITHSGKHTFSFFKNKIYLPPYVGSPDYIFTARVKTHWRWFKNSWIKNVLKSRRMSFKLEVDSKANSISNLTIESDPVVDGYIGWQDDNQNYYANVYINKKPE